MFENINFKKGDPWMVTAWVFDYVTNALSDKFEENRRTDLFKMIKDGMPPNTRSVNFRELTDDQAQGLMKSIDQAVEDLHYVGSDFFGSTEAYSEIDRSFIKLREKLLNQHVPKTP